MKHFSAKEILIPIDFSELSMLAIDYAVKIAKIHDSKIHLINIIEDMLPMVVATDFYGYADDFVAREKDILKFRTEKFDKLIGRLNTEHGNIFSYHVYFGRSHKSIKQFIEEKNIDFVVMSTHGVSGFREFVIGSNAVRIISEVSCPVLSIQKKMSDRHFKKVLLQFRDEPHSREKVNYAIDFAKWFNAEIVILGIDTEGDEEDIRKITLEAEQIKRITDDHGVKNTMKVVTASNVAKTILDTAKEENVDLIVLTADMDKANISEYIMGPVAQQVINHSVIPILSIQPSYHPNTINLHPYGW